GFRWDETAGLADQLGCPHALEVQKGDQPMRKLSKQAQRKQWAQDKPAMTMGIDVGDRFSHVCLLDDEGEVVERDRVRSTEAAFRRHFEGAPRLRIALECGTHSPWMSRLLKQLGHQA